jgi:hypothetical protein
MTTTLAPVSFRTLEDSMTTSTRQTTMTAYYLGRPAALWRTAMAPRPEIHESPRGSLAKSERPAAE